MRKAGIGGMAERQPARERCGHGRHGTGKRKRKTRTGGDEGRARGVKSVVSPRTGPHIDQNLTTRAIHLPRGDDETKVVVGPRDEHMVIAIAMFHEVDCVVRRRKTIENVREVEVTGIPGESAVEAGTALKRHDEGILRHSLHTVFHPHLRPEQVTRSRGIENDLVHPNTP